MSLASTKQIDRLAAVPTSEGSGELRWSTGYIPVLDGLRACAVLGVMFYHFLFRDTLRDCTGWASRLQTMASWGWCGVDLFFVLSGFLITGILLDAKENRSPNYFKSFYVRRSLRIFPLYYGVVTLVAIGMLSPRISIFFGFDSIQASLAWMFAYLGNFYLAFHDKNGFGPIGHFWSLAVEEHFYLVWPALVWLCSRRVFAVICGGFVLMAFALRTAIVLHMGETHITYLLTPCRVDGLALGGLLALLVRTDIPVRGARQLAWAVGGVSLAGVVGLSFLRGGFNHYGRTMNTLGFTVLAGAFTSAIALLISAPPTSRVRQLLEMPGVISVGKYSFAMYVFHQIFLQPFLICFSPDFLGRVFHSRNAGILAFALLSAATTYFIAFASWHLYERHFLKLKRFFPY